MDGRFKAERPWFCGGGDEEWGDISEDVKDGEVGWTQL